MLPLGVILLGGILSAAGTAASAPAKRPRAPEAAPRETLQRLEDLRREVGLLKLELELAKTREAYAVIDLERSKLLFRVRGRTMKEYPILRASFDTQPASVGPFPSDVFNRVYKLEGHDGKEIPVKLLGAVAQPEPPPGKSSSSPPRQDAAGATASTATMIAPDPPPRYLWRLDHGVSIYVLEQESPKDPWTGRAERFLAFARGLGRQWMHITGQGPRGVVITLVMEGEKSRESYRSLLDGQSVIVLAPSPASE